MLDSLNLSHTFRLCYSSYCYCFPLPAGIFDMGSASGGFDLNCHLHGVLHASYKFFKLCSCRILIHSFCTIASSYDIYEEYKESQYFKNNKIYNNSSFF